MKIGRKHLELALRWVPSAATYGTTATLAALYVTDWQMVCQYIPFYGGKFKN